MLATPFRAYAPPIKRLKLRAPLAQRLAQYIDYRGCDEWCWLWMGARTSGYGVLAVGGKGGRPLRAHRLVYELLVGPIPEGLELDHLCRNHACVNPLHVEPVTHQVNVLRGNTFAARNAAKTHCPQGHPYDAENTYYPPSEPGARACKTCRLRVNREWSKRQRQAA